MREQTVRACRRPKYFEKSEQRRNPLAGIRNTVLGLPARASARREPTRACGGPGTLRVEAVRACRRPKDFRKSEQHRNPTRGISIRGFEATGAAPRRLHGLWAKRNRSIPETRRIARGGGSLPAGGQISAFESRSRECDIWWRRSRRCLVDSQRHYGNLRRARVHELMWWAPAAKGPSLRVPGVQVRHRQHHVSPSSPLH
ncbi:hypothetical protein DFH06DRAFT_1184641 [Mycena polygramma]|nr:hypothetical protein DFH06DRAFT_1184597 [Mycena polygramma]KAJ7666728.1 hypothetical protein DFH06DRAFT_1184613 [Mycena polygramma]KAJ7666736.1 hypothetical protein DFH06DRAFT_1184641 [Mycena polygramma]